MAEGTIHNYGGQEAKKDAGGQLQPLKAQAQCSIFSSWTHLQVPVFSHTRAAMLGNKHSPRKPVANFPVRSYKLYLRLNQSSLGLTLPLFCVECEFLPAAVYAFMCHYDLATIFNFSTMSSQAIPPLPVGMFFFLL